MLLAQPAQTLGVTCMVVEAVSLRRIEDGERRSSPHSPASDDEPGLTSIPTLSGATRSSMVTNNPASGRLRHPSLPFPFPPKETSYRLNSAFFLFGLLNNSLYVVILTAALELLPQGVPTGLVRFANIFPALIAKAVWP